MKRWICYVTFISLCPWVLFAQDRGRLEVYGFIMLDGGYNFNAIDPDWYDVMRPTKLPSQENEFAPSGTFYYSIRQTRLGIRSTTPTKLGELKTRFDFDLFGFGKDVGNTTFHLINAYAELGKLGVGQTASVLMDQDVFPVTLDYWGPCSRTFFFNIQVRYTPKDNEHERIAIALERPGATADGSAYRSHIDIENVEPQFPVPNLTAHYRRKTSWGHAQAGGILKVMKWNDLQRATGYELSGQALGWGFNASAVVKVDQLLTIKTQATYGHGIQNYVADAPTDVALQSDDSDPLTPFRGKAVPLIGYFAFAELTWSRQLRTSIGYSFEQVENTDLQHANAFRRGQYGLVNVRYYPVDHVQVGVEYQYGRRDNYADGFYSISNKIQVSFKIDFLSQL